MLAEERRQRILELVAENDTVSVADLASQFCTSESTVRRDLERLEAAGLLVKVHGGAASVDSKLRPSGISAAEPTMAEKRELHAPEKRAIAAWAALRIESDDFVYLDAGTTTQAVIAQLGEAALKATFVTDSVTCALELASRGARAIVIGGDIKAGTEAIVGSVAVDALSRYNFSKGFFGANGVTLEQGFTTPEPNEAMVKLTAVNRCRERYVLADPSKIGAITPISFCEFDRAVLVTTVAADTELSAKSNVVEVNA